MYDDILYSSDDDDEDYDNDQNSPIAEKPLDNSSKIARYEAAIAEKLATEARLASVDKKLANTRILEKSLDIQARKVLADTWLKIHLENDAVQHETYRIIHRFYWLKIEQVREKNPIPVWRLRRGFRDISRMSRKIFEKSGKREFFLFAEWVTHLDSLVKLNSQVSDERFSNRILENEYCQEFSDKDDYSIMPVNRNVAVKFKRPKQLDAALHNKIFEGTISLGLLPKK